MHRCDYNFAKFNHDAYLITNYAGRYLFLSEADFEDFCRGNPSGAVKERLVQSLFYSDSDKESFARTSAEAVRQYRDYLFSGTGLHIFVLTSQCNLKCVYCQASTQHSGEMMSKETAEKAARLALQSPSNSLSFEFQGGEPLENFEALRHIVLYAEEHCGEKHIEFNLVSNLTLLNDEMLDFIAAHRINVSTSLDGHKALQNGCRPHPDCDGYELWRRNYSRLRARLQRGIGAIQTTTRQSLPYYKEIVDEYINNGMDRVFVRPLTPLGYAAARWDKIGYTEEEFLDFYRSIFYYILEKAKHGIPISEGHAVLFLHKILTHRAGNYTELRSPCGAGLGQLAYNYDGKIYTCDEGRMLAEMGDDTFQLGTVDTEYALLLNGSVCRAVAAASCLESIPQCCDCVYAPFCGTCPVLNYYEQHNIFPARPNGYKCKIYKGMLDIIFERLYVNDPEEMQIFSQWCR